MWMSDDEIRMSYRQAKTPARQIKILADLNVCKAADIRRILGIAAAQKDKGGTGMAIDQEKAKELYDTGLSDNGVAKALGVSTATIQRWRAKTGLKPNYKQVGSIKRKEEPVTASPCSLKPNRGFFTAVQGLLALHSPTDTPEVRRKFRELAEALFARELDDIFGASGGEQ